MMVFAITDEINNKKSNGLAPISIGFVVLVIGFFKKNLKSISFIMPISSEIAAKNFRS